MVRIIAGFAIVLAGIGFIFLNSTPAEEREVIPVPVAVSTDDVVEIVELPPRRLEMIAADRSARAHENRVLQHTLADHRTIGSRLTSLHDQQVRAHAEEQARVTAAQQEAARQQTTTAAPSTSAPAASTAPAAPTGSVWDQLAQCESGGNWHINTGNGYYGGLQFLPATWHSVGGTGLPHEHSREEQIHRGQILQQRAGWGQWPACARKLGLR